MQGRHVVRLPAPRIEYGAVNWWRNGKTWMWGWLCFIAFMLMWSVGTVLWWMDSTRNVNALSLVANVGMGVAGMQASLAMRKADDKDHF